MTRKTLYRADRTIEVPFQIVLKDHQEAVTCRQIIRIVPGKRLLAFGMWGGKEVAVKLFYEKRGAKCDAERDAFGVESLMQANVPTPKLLYKGSMDKNRIYILIFEKINQGMSLGDIWQKKDKIADVELLLQAVTIELATQHVLGILQRDLHLNNFLITEKNIYTLDGGKIKSYAQPLDKTMSIEYLALFLVQLGVGFEKLQQELFDVYTKSRGWIVKPADIKEFNKCIAQQTKERMQKFKRKMFRSCTSFKCIKKLNKTVVYDRQYESAEFNHLLQNPDAFIDNPTAKLLKKGRSSTVARIEINGRILAVKRYNIKNFWHWLRCCLRPSRAKKSWRIAQQLYVSGIATPKPVAFIETNVLGFRGKSYFIMEYVDGKHIGKYFDSHKQDMKTCERMAKDTLSLFENLFRLRITHGDLKMTNIMVVNDVPCLIDFDGAEEHVSSIALRRSFDNEINRFMKNWEKNPPIHQLFEQLIPN